MRTFQFNKGYVKKLVPFLSINLPLKSLEINLSDRIQEERGHFGALGDIVNFMKHDINDEDRVFLSGSKSLGATVLYAHGGKHKKFKWYFVDNQRAKSILKWIREKDGKFDLIIVMACNPGKLKKIETKKSFLIMPSNTFSRQYLANKWVKIILIKPKNSKRLTK